MRVHPRLIRSFVATLVLVAGASSALADQLYTLSSIDDGSGKTAGGTIVADSTGRRFVVKHPYFSELMGEVNAITVLADLAADGKTLDVKWAKAVVTEEIKLSGGKKLKKGTELKVLDKENLPFHPEDGEIQSRWKVILPDGSTIKLAADDEFSISVEDESGKISSDRIEGVVRSAGGDFFIDRPDGKSTKVVGASAQVLKDAVGLFVEGYGLSYGPSSTFEFAYIEGASKKKTRARTTTTSSAKTTDIDKAEHVALVKADKPGFYTIRINWPGIGSSAGVRQAFVKREDVAVGARWVVAEGTVAKKTVDNEEVYTIKTANETFTVNYGSGGLTDSLLEGRVGKKVKFGGVVLNNPGYALGELQLKWLESTVTKEIPAKNGQEKIAKGTAVRLFDVKINIVDPDDHSVLLPSGKVAHLVAADLEIGAPSATPGVTGALTTPDLGRPPGSTRTAPCPRAARAPTPGSRAPRRRSWE
ncbi:MAG: hypothetical protein ACAI25_18350 [Planctomycetota bacterium]